MANAAAEEVAGYEGKIAGTEKRLAVLTWMVGANLTLTLLIAGSLFALWTKLAEISGQLAQVAARLH